MKILKIITSVIWFTVYSSFPLTSNFLQVNIKSKLVWLTQMPNEEMKIRKFVSVQNDHMFKIIVI